MSKRYGGEHSPTGQRDTGAPRQTVTAERLEVPSFRGRKPMRHGAKINMLFVLPLIALASALINGQVSALAADLSGVAALFLGAWLTRDGVRAEDAFDERKVARRPAIPRKLFGSVATGLGTGLLVFGGNWNPATAIVIGVIAAGLHLVSFGLDPMKDKGLEGVDRHQTDRIARKIEEAERVLSEMSDAIRRARDRQLEGRVDRFEDTVRQMFRQVEADPRDLSSARRYLGVYLQGARDATVQFADLYARNREPQIRADYIAFLDDLEDNFAKRTRAMLTDDRSNLDIEIEVLRERLNRENLHIEE
ncbi:5-bromo-4-chloroindolyl phosphate hydrolysis family protein [Roseibacterium sp. SDUM158016]|uniref:5-bromo-4-chloroindolyl phosphate hydrolysis family protein n=1 Tax=Roseicyclus sediminis TaxID=2980997 RepID=UPI0021CF1BC8|nr:5-bromo-4-chloroindolyl phosphate hydrolysis family protein [Roseibacterium sp. SDUM158016]MCU4653825.1 5-bromo-4-chloroindolyl phosphate hydrolysis family protein [Roseibacterium sp. SDUM158016]